MSSSAITLQPQQPLSITDTRKTIDQMVAQRDAIVEAMRKVMKPDIDYGLIPGTPKPTLYKPGSEKILSMFHLAPTPKVEDISTGDTIRYRVTVEITHAPTGVYVGAGIGEASSAESKYQWREVVCDEEWDATDADRRRVKWKKPDKWHKGPWSVRQVRAEMEDVANTVLKMAKKRAQIDAVLTATAASDVFSQDLKDLRDNGVEVDGDEDGAATPQPAQTSDGLERKPAAVAPAAQAQPSAGKVSHPPQGSAACISEGEAKRFWAIAMGRVNDYKVIMSYLDGVHGVKNKNLILSSRYAEAIKWAETGQVED